jgi:hypothetical protein
MLERNERTRREQVKMLLYIPKLKLIDIGSFLASDTPSPSRLLLSIITLSTIASSRSPGSSLLLVVSEY